MPAQIGRCDALHSFPTPSVSRSPFPSRFFFLRSNRDVVNSLGHPYFVQSLQSLTWISLVLQCHIYATKRLHYSMAFQYNRIESQSPDSEINSHVGWLSNWARFLAALNSFLSRVQQRSLELQLPSKAYLRNLWYCAFLLVSPCLVKRNQKKVRSVRILVINWKCQTTYSHWEVHVWLKVSDFEIVL